MKHLSFTRSRSMLLISGLYFFLSLDTQAQNARGNQFLDNLQSNQLPAAYALFDSVAQAMVSPEQFEQVWASILQNYGLLQDYTYACSQQMNAYQANFYTLTFEEASLQFVLTTSEKNTVMGMQLTQSIPCEQKEEHPKDQGSDRPFRTQEIQINPLLEGTRYFSKTGEKGKHLILLIAGSGPTDRHGNQAGMQTNSLKLLAEGLVSEQFDVFSYDKRLFALAKKGKLDERMLNFEQNIEDTRAILDYFSPEYEKLIVIGHSEGSLVGMITAQDQADAFVSLAGPGRSADEILLEQLGSQFPMHLEKTRQYLDLAKEGVPFTVDVPVLTPVFRESVQPYLHSWMSYDPADEISKISVPILIVHGTEDLQVKEQDFRLLQKSNPAASSLLVKGMNHVFKEITGGREENLASYSDPTLPIAPELVKGIRKFLTELTPE